MQEENALSMLNASAHFTAGWVSGCAGVLVSHPLDTIKVRLQTQGVVPNIPFQYKGTWHCFSETVKREGVYGLFKGMSSPLLGTALWNAVVFGSYGNTVRYLAGDNIQERHRLKNVFIGSIAAGVAQTFIICPLELTKTRLQVQSSAESKVYTGLIDCVRKIYRQEGVKGLFRGYGGTMYRDLIGFSFYFVPFEMLCRLISNEAAPYSNMGVFSLVMAGGICGAFSWTMAFPADVIKCRIQVDYAGKYNGFFDCLQKSYREEGMMLFRRGLAPCVLRGFPMNAAIFSIYHLMMRFYEEKEVGQHFASYLI